MRKIYKEKIQRLEKEDLMIVESLDNLCDRVAKMEKDFETLVAGLVVTMALSGCKDEIKKETPKKINKKKETK